jgi:hypothetical protein
VAREHPDVRRDPPAAAARTVAHKDRSAVTRGDIPGRQPAAVVGGDADVLVRDPEFRVVDRPARRVRDQVGLGERHHGEHRDGDGANDPDGGVADALARPRSRAGTPRRGGRCEAGRDEQESADDVANAGDVAPVGAGVDDVQAVRGDAETDRDQSDHDAQREARGSRDVRLDQRPGHRHGKDHEDAEHGRVGP